MNADQVIEGIGKAVAAAQPVPEYCLFEFWGVTWWPMCMTKAEWSGWVQAIGSIAAIGSGFLLVRYQMRASAKQAIEVKRDNERKEACKKYLALLYMFSDIRSFAEMIVRVHTDDYIFKNWSAIENQFEECMVNISSISSSEIPSVHSIIDLNATKRCISTALDVFRHNIDNDLQRSEIIEALKMASDKLYELLDAQCTDYVNQARSLCTEEEREMILQESMNKINRLSKIFPLNGG